MFGFMKKLIKNNNENSKSFRIEMAKHLDKRHVKYVTERIDDTDIIIGRDGGINVRDGELMVLSSLDIVFRAKVTELKASELLSLEGVILTGPDLEHGGKERTVIAYYKYYR